MHKIIVLFPYQFLPPFAATVFRKMLSSFSVHLPRLRWGRLSSSSSLISLSLSCASCVSDICECCDNGSVDCDNGKDDDEDEEEVMEDWEHGRTDGKDGRVDGKVEEEDDVVLFTVLFWDSIFLWYYTETNELPLQTINKYTESQSENKNKGKRPEEKWGELEK